MIGVIDLGSNTLDILLFDGKEYLRFSDQVGTAVGMESDGKITAEAIERIVYRLKYRLKGLKLDKMLAYATEALRVASNAPEVIAKIKRCTGVSFEIITAHKEANLVRRAITARMNQLQLDIRAATVVDIGGASTELISLEHGESHSFAYGVVRSCHNQAEALLAFKKELRESAGGFRGSQTLIATAGTPTLLAMLALGMSVKSYDKERINGYLLTLGRAKSELARVAQLGKKEQKELIGDVSLSFVQTGLLLLEALLDFLNKEEMVVIDDGLCEGMMLEALGL